MAFLTMQLTFTDWFVVALYFLFNIGIGLYYRSRAGQERQRILSLRSERPVVAGGDLDGGHHVRGAKDRRERVKSSKYVIAGGGMVAGYAAKELVERGLKPGELTIFSADSSIPYERPPLSKGFLAGKDTEESIRLNPADFYREHGIDVRLQCQVEGLDSGSKTLHLQPGGEFGFEKLVLATGARVKALDVPGSNLAGICYLRSLEDSKRIRLQSEHAKRVLVIGGGFIGMEVAAVLAQKGIAVTMVLHDDRIWKQFFTPAMSKFFEDYYVSRDVRFVKRANIAELRGNGTVKSVALESGESVPCDLA